MLRHVDLQASAPAEPGSGLTTAGIDEVGEALGQQEADDLNAKQAALPVELDRPEELCDPEDQTMSQSTVLALLERFEVALCEEDDRLDLPGEASPDTSSQPDNTNTVGK